MFNPNFLNYDVTIKKAKQKPGWSATTYPGLQKNH
jgi:hypothetical protein